MAYEWKSLQDIQRSFGRQHSLVRLMQNEMVPHSQSIFVPNREYTYMSRLVIVSERGCEPIDLAH